ncbi:MULTISPECIES: 2-hydroxyacid dehydrogenase [unclassified Sphingomonas]|uniref:2-hydroxyacid dehydrogenase n=1 Tax=unclassified Sphingomonas TaxID=196159 RepID=UPI0007013949|nr:MULTISPECIES: 2-hydroxyacid dehydrogenase [unclassified Sphingomonas]KQX17942.1 hydroxyacid dehydrogenase [Sphingomonas sp. Root1294]KQY70867.1 hydroxyacid dehydrogenase [Sphingomonas sp. Root50]KRB91639.1 hydroxyacid dehydrogenase [Sphingomonas sp. Root720]
MTILQTSPLAAPRQPVDMLDHPVPMLDRLDDPDGWLAEHGGSVECLITHAMCGASADLLARLPKLKLIANFGAGIDLIDFAAVRAGGIAVTASGDVLTHDVADLALWQMLTLLRGNGGADAFVRAGGWLEGPLPLGRSTQGRKLGILGFGRIGQAIAHRADAVGMQVAYFSRRPIAGSAASHEADALALARWADIVTIALPGGAATHSLVDRAFLDALGPDGLLVNIARGSVVDEDALAAALHEGRLGGAALDVFRNEPAIAPALLSAPNLLLTPHIGSATQDARLAMLGHVVDNIRAFLEGRPLSGLVGANAQDDATALK